MRIVGTASPGFLITHGHHIPVKGLTPSVTGERVAVVGTITWKRTEGSYFQAHSWTCTDELDSNFVQVEGVVVGIQAVHRNRRHQKLIHFLIKQRDSRESVVLITALTSEVNPVIGVHIHLSGYILQHRRGLQVLCRNTSERRKSHAGEV